MTQEESIAHREPETKTTWSILLLVGFGGLLLLGIVAYAADSYRKSSQQIQPPPTPAPEPPPVSKCGNLDPAECARNIGCQVIMKTGSCSARAGDIVPQVEVYCGCELVSEEVLTQRVAQKSLCEETKGEWQGQFCFCLPSKGTAQEITNEGGWYFFSREKGCVLEKDLCLETGGKWENPECLCPSGKYILERGCLK